MFPPDPDSCAQARRAAEGAQNDAELLRLRQLERAHMGMPPIIDGARREALLWTDPIATVWSGWDSHSGQRLLMRCLRPYWRDDPVMRRRMAQGVKNVPATLSALSWHEQGDWPHLRVHLHGPLLSELPHLESASRAAVLAAAISGLQSLHRHGLWLGEELFDHLALSDGKPVLIWLDRFAAPGNQAADLTAIGRLAQRLNIDDDDDLSRLVSTWQFNPPPTADDAGLLLQRAMASTLAEARHRLASQHRRQDVRRLRRTLQQCVEHMLGLPIPTFRACLAASTDQPPTVVFSDGQTLSGGQGEIGALPVVASRRGHVDVSACRGLLRAARRHSIDNDGLRQAVDAKIHGDSTQRTAAIGWMVARLQLRSLALLLERQIQSSSVTDSK